MATAGAGGSTGREAGAGTTSVPVADIATTRVAAFGCLASAGQRGPAPESRDYMRSIIALPNPEHDTWVAPGISRAKS